MAMSEKWPPWSVGKRLITQAPRGCPTLLIPANTGRRALAAFVFIAVGWATGCSGFSRSADGGVQNQTSTQPDGGQPGPTPDAGAVDASAAQTPDSGAPQPAGLDVPVLVRGLPADFLLGPDVNGDGLPDAYRFASTFPSPECLFYVALAVRGAGFAQPRLVDHVAQGCTEAPVVMDWNGDGTPDVGLVLGTESCSVYLGAGLGPVTPMELVPYRCAMLVKDLNGDGQADVMQWGETVAQPSGFQLSQPDHQRTQTAFLPAGQEPVLRLSALDLDGDNIQEVLMLRALRDVGTLWLARQDELGAYVEESTGISFPIWPWLLVVADLNGDGREDALAVLGEEADRTCMVASLIANDNGTIARGPELGIPMPARAFATRVDEDAFPDLVIATDRLDVGEPGVLVVYWGDGAGGFPTSTTIFNGGTLPQLSMVEDVDADGRVDLLVEGRMAHLGSGQRHFKVPQVSVVDRMGWTQVTLWDTSGDGLADVLVNTGGQLLSLELSAQGTVTRVTPCPELPPFVHNILVDQDGNGVLDRFVTNGVDLYFQGGRGGCAFEPESLLASFMTSALLLDINTDGLADLFGNVFQEGLVCRVATALGTFLPAVSVPPDLSWDDRLVQMLDFNGDGAPDLLKPMPGTQGWYPPYRVWWGDGACNFIPGPVLDWGLGEREGHAVADVDGDGAQELIVALRSGELDIAAWDGATVQYRRVAGQHAGPVEPFPDILQHHRPTILRRGPLVDSVLEWNGVAFETALQIPARGGVPFDLDADGDLDVFFLQNGSNNRGIGVALNHVVP